MQFVCVLRWMSRPLHYSSGKGAINIFFFGRSEWMSEVERNSYEEPQKSYLLRVSSIVARSRRHILLNAEIARVLLTSPPPTPWHASLHSVFFPTKSIILLCSGQLLSANWFGLSIRFGALAAGFNHGKISTHVEMSSMVRARECRASFWTY